MSKTIVTCNQLKKSYGDEKESRVVALSGLDLTVQAEELLMLVGPSGCGKTTLLSIMSGILTQDSGDCILFGHDLNKMKDDQKSALRKNKVGFVFQAFNLIPMLSALENTTIPLILNGFDPQEANSIAAKLLTRVGLGSRLDALPSHLSGGEKQRVAICRGCIHKPGLIVCDEPTSNLDHQTGIQVLKLLKELAISEKSALVIVTHDPRIFDFADRLLHMDDGRIVREETNGT